MDIHVVNEIDLGGPQQDGGNKPGIPAIDQFPELVGEEDPCKRKRSTGSLKAKSEMPKRENDKALSQKRSGGFWI